MYSKFSFGGGGVHHRLNGQKFSFKTTRERSNKTSSANVSDDIPPEMNMVIPFCIQQGHLCLIVFSFFKHIFR